MKKYFVLCFVVFGSLASSNVWAQLSERENDFSSATAFNNFSQIKARIADLMMINKKLEAQYSLLMQEMQTMQESTESLEQDLQTMGVDVKRFNPLQGKDVKQLNQGEDSLSLQNQLLIKESKVTFLKRQSLDLDDKIKLLQSEISALEVQRNGLMAKLEAHRLASVEQMDLQAREMDMLKAKLQSMEDQYKDSEMKIAEAKNQGQLSSDQMSQLMQANKQLELLLAQHKIDLSIKQKEVDIARDKRTLANRTTQVEFQEARATNVSLQDEVAALEKEYQSLDETVNKSASWQINKKQLVENIIRLDKENQGMREKIAGLQDQIEELK